MNKTFLLILRLIIAMLLLINIYHETGIFTTLVIVILYGGIEVEMYTHNKLVKKLEDLQRILQTYQDRSIEQGKAYIESVNEICDLINRKRPNWMSDISRHEGSKPFKP